ncbi:retrotransposon protein, putative, ty1-copia subclass [Tanacetum coccineum]|uniref:Retrotransposon protein, putative, ty1-copia subclass n=1 Tax=Tanacetum coccineum TaxID=301880 RepID=A0ABQ5FFJ5_9ASTR
MILPWLNMVKHALGHFKVQFQGIIRKTKGECQESKGCLSYLAPKVGIVKQKVPGDLALTVTSLVTVLLIARCQSGYKPGGRAVDNGQKLYMGNSATADIKGEGDVVLKMTSEKELKLTNVLYVLEIQSNVFVRVMPGMVCLATMNGHFVKNEISKMNSSAYLMSLLCYRQFVLYKTEVENSTCRKSRVVRSDRGGEYVAPFAELCAKHRIRHEFTAPYSPQQNSIAERKNEPIP